MSSEVPSVRIPKPLPDGVSQATIGVRGGLLRSNFEETSEALFLNSGYTYASASAAEQAFTGEIDRFVYSRYGNPTVQMFEERLRLMEGAEAAFGTASGMAAVFTALGALVGAGDRLVAARSLFGSCFVVCNEILPRWGVETVFVDGEDLDQWEQALSVPTQAVFFETPSNPMQALVDIAAVAEMSHAAGAQVVLDNVFATPLLQQGLPLGADVVVYSGTKHIDGQGRVLGGAILGTREYIDGPVQTLMRHTGPALSPFNAWTLLKGLETMPLRVAYSNDSALRIAEFLEAHPAVSWVKYPFLPSHPQYELARRQMSGGGTVITFELVADDGDGKARAFEVLDKLKLIDISNNLGDSKTLITHPATTTHRAMGPEGRAAIGLGDGVVRISVGLEGTEDLLADLEQALSLRSA
ncbi:O-succinylhomoserine sulfhydrylase [Mycolicibacterium brumae]|uniref:O-succinylhomoserine sulfhydrylase n=1 Tax=Mycolicibacterium brumae TaxID=85968 RepID=A0A2G5PGJ2_9MYCO|nr:O-succinylhomoserine sulfhydrylase [Mycolicibacterium brumae]MCV7192592.1 O-succinylhomoserine sulfhydrylase [Mycolicibacterium brumae]PIB77421.1 O-succinylhomoserine sulfhydrylase [Mycolicibacterium brumae]RWA18416.1 O-succinylhomoserine sulfhydrylase [Mycolicibacterium brumae DSM 44177]UWW10362.1 O-succinylhomoserine sulfhydrylase [Mycolicibacterium brumae]